jgi:hypothetical protein
MQELNEDIELSRKRVEAILDASIALTKQECELMEPGPNRDKILELIKEYETI